MISAVCGRAPAEAWLANAPFAPAADATISHDSLSMMNTRGLSAICCAKTKRTVIASTMTIRIVASEEIMIEMRKRGRSERLGGLIVYLYLFAVKHSLVGLKLRERLDTQVSEYPHSTDAGGDSLGSGSGRRVKMSTSVHEFAECGKISLHRCT
jgi:hypothetical protein